ncbi:MAG TPA: VOC family protein [Burkholderiaceae bacterium]|nr:VOC family protein [Burkholderiaceae bacterium]
MKLGYVIVYVNDVEASLAFFEKAFGLSRSFLSEGGEFGTLDTGTTSLAFAAHQVARTSVSQYVVAADSPVPLGMEVAMVTPDVAAACNRAVTAGAALVQAPVTKPWGQTVAYVRAPDGTLVELCTPMD